MSREQYQVPTSSGQPSFSQKSGGGGGDMMMDSGITQTSRYLCGDCGHKNPVRRGEPIRCKDCGCRVLYKERTKRMVQFEAR